MKSITRKFAAKIVGIGTLALVSMGIWTGESRASLISSNNVTALTITIRPNADRGVDISSSASTLDLGTMDMSLSTYTVLPATITIMGNMATTELTLGSTITALTVGEPSWLFDDVPTSTETDRLAVWALFSGVAIASAPTPAEFELYNATVTQSMVATAVDVGDTAARFESAWPSSDMDDLTSATKRHLWIRMRTPLNTSEGTLGQQAVRFNMTVEAAD